ncbi:site-2 protease family protein [Zunongwangia endophytica]|uniref:Site-2 protease family protein n=1 Tax=Zunongwangia endophytica TaxID=1808945 RepID=A0ABV8H4D9_9FLAO|nr:site-2 protease family protein [Zunongwangia endophytica]MDN3595547.1 site-2 protease family protein [Zunongwangia endophytica]
MIEFWDIPKLFIAFFIILPAVSLVHELGHVFIAKLLGAKNVKIIIGSGRILVDNRYFEIRKYYFYYGYCYFENIYDESRWRNLFIYSGGILGNILSSCVVIYIVTSQALVPTIFTYQFLYFSLYYVFFALLPMSYPDGNYSDGKIIYHLLKRNHTLLQQKQFQLWFDEDEKSWRLSSESEEEFEQLEDYDEAYEKALQRARASRPSKLEVIKKNTSHFEIFPRNPI